MYNPRKASQIVAFFTLKTGERAINVLKAVKLVYLADRENIAISGFPILDERRVSMKHGPVNSYTYDYIKGEVHPDYDNGWSDFVSDREGHNVGIANESISFEDFDELSDAELETLEKVWNKFGHMDQWQLVSYTHIKDNIPEWEKPQGQGSITIPLKNILSAVSVPAYEEHAYEIESLNSATQFLKGL